MTTEYFETGIKKGRGMAQRSLDLIEAMHNFAEAAQPITGRGIGYKPFTAGLIPSMANNEMQRVYRLLKEAREEGEIPWEWIPIATISGTNSPSAVRFGTIETVWRVHCTPYRRNSSVISGWLLDAAAMSLFPASVSPFLSLAIPRP